MLRYSAVVFFAAVYPALAHADPSFDCARATSSAENLICADAELARLDRLLADRYSAALKQVQALDVGASAAEDELRATQRGWIKGRDDCWKADSLRACVEDAYLRREGALVARWFLQDPVAVAYWSCGDTPANEVVIYHFDTTRPSIRFERGDAVDTGSLVPTGSGAKYEGSFGRSIWIKGGEATYRDADPDGTTYSCALARQE